MREGEEAASYWVLGDPARVLTSLTFEDVRQLANPLAEAAAEVELTTYDGLSLKASLYDMDGASWVQIAAEFDAGLQSEGAAGELPNAPADGAAEAQAIQSAVRGWVFKLSSNDAAILKRKRADFLAAATE